MRLVMMIHLKINTENDRVCCLLVYMSAFWSDNQSSTPDKVFFY